MHGCNDIPLVRTIFSRDERSRYKKASLYLVVRLQSEEILLMTELSALEESLRYFMLRSTFERIRTSSVRSNSLSDITTL